MRFSKSGKLKTCELVIGQLGFQCANSLVSGDRGNDESIYSCPFVQDVVVRNALPVLVVVLQAIARYGCTWRAM